MNGPEYDWLWRCDTRQLLNLTAVLRDLHRETAKKDCPEDEPVCSKVALLPPRSAVGQDTTFKDSQCEQRWNTAKALVDNRVLSFVEIKRHPVSRFSDQIEFASTMEKIRSALAAVETEIVRRDPRRRVFIGHGHSDAWQKLRDYLVDVLRLEWDEFNRVPCAGVSTIDRLRQMLAQARFAFLVLTAEDEQSDGTIHPRMNVVHEAGLFQGRFGFERAILLVEEGADQFSNVAGLSQILFPKGSIEQVFGEVRRTLERERILGEGS